MHCGPVVEFVGPPASGKTSVMSAVRDHLALNSPSLKIEHVDGARRAESIVTAAAELVSANLTNLRVWDIYLSVLPSLSPGMRIKATRIAAMLNVRRQRIAARRPASELLLVDHGILQGLWSLYFRTEGSLESSKVLRLMEALPAPCAVVALQARSEVLLERLRGRPIVSPWLNTQASDLAERLARAQALFEALPNLGFPMVHISTDSGRGVGELGEQVLADLRTVGVITRQ